MGEFEQRQRALRIASQIGTATGHGIAWDANALVSADDLMPNCVLTRVRFSASPNVDARRVVLIETTVPGTPAERRANFISLPGGKDTTVDPENTTPPNNNGAA